MLCDLNLLDLFCNHALFGQIPLSLDKDWFAGVSTQQLASRFFKVENYGLGKMKRIREESQAKWNKQATSF